MSHPGGSTATDRIHELITLICSHLTMLTGFRKGIFEGRIEKEKTSCHPGHASLCHPGHRAGIPSREPVILERSDRIHKELKEHCHSEHSEESRKRFMYV